MTALNNRTIERLKMRTHTHISTYLYGLLCAAVIFRFSSTHTHNSRIVRQNKGKRYICINKKIANNNTTATVRNKKSATAITTMLT